MYIYKKKNTNKRLCYIKSSSQRINSPISAWLKHTTDSGSVCLHSVVLLAATPKP